MLVWVCLLAIGLFGLMWGLEALRAQQRARERMRGDWRERLMRATETDAHEGSEAVKRPEEE
jgi:hypothetical protein